MGGNLYFCWLIGLFLHNKKAHIWFLCKVELIPKNNFLLI